MIDEFTPIVATSLGYPWHVGLVGWRIHRRNSKRKEEVNMSMFGNNIWATGEMNPSNFAMNANLQKARKASMSSAPTVSDSMVGAPLANNSPSYPTQNLGLSYMDTSTNAKLISAAVGLVGGYALTNIIGYPIVSYPLTLAASTQLAKYMSKGRV